MNILLIGAGGREHTIAWKLTQSPLCSNLYIAPGNAGTALHGINLSIDITDFDGLRKAALKYDIGMMIVGPEEPLVKGITDFFSSGNDTKDIIVIGPSQFAAQLEGSKSFAKSFMQRHGIPTAGYREFTQENYEEGIAYIRSHPLPIVLKADGLAAGKGVLICQNLLEALAEFELMIMRSKFGEAGKKVVVEEFLTGIEVSVFVLTDGRQYFLLPEAKDYKRAGEGDKGLNTGGMGAVSPVPFFDEPLRNKITKQVIEPTIAGLQKDQMDYKGFIFFGLMIDQGEPKVIEYNCRMGDPETEVVLPRLQNDLVALLSSVADGTLGNIEPQVDEQSAVAVVAVSGGYPGKYQVGIPIQGLSQPPLEGSLVFHAGTKKEDASVLTSGGRVLVVTSFGQDIREASELSNYMLEQLYFDDMYFRTDIGYEFI